ncbi:LOW QUALITY PROTEIN: regulatory protein, partial [Streptomyces sviceus ATCC 29083]
MNGTALQDRPSASASWRIALPHSAAAVPVARALVRTALAELEHGADCDTAELLTAELVANAVEHTAGDTPIELVVELLPTGCQVGGARPGPGAPGASHPAGHHGPGPLAGARPGTAPDQGAQLVVRSPPDRDRQGGVVPPQGGAASVAPGV